LQLKPFDLSSHIGLWSNVLIPVPPTEPWPGTYGGEAAQMALGLFVDVGKLVFAAARGLLFWNEPDTG
jgi:hypothetical protein